MMKRFSLISLFVMLLFAAVNLYAQPQPPQPPPPDDPIARNLFPPELVMRFQHEIGLNENQSTAIRSEIQKMQSRFVDLQWQMESEKQKLVQLLQAPAVEESKVLAEADRVMNLETEIKKTHLSLLVRIKNQLNEEQQKKLAGLRPRP
jgi:Spy/CpxP family protein refolding chaperone